MTFVAIWARKFFDVDAHHSEPCKPARLVNGSDDFAPKAALKRIA